MVLGKKLGTNLPTRKIFLKQYPGETLKDAWVRVNRINYENPTPLEDEELNLYFYYGIDPWYQNALDGATGGSFVLSPPHFAALTLKRFFGNFEGGKEKLKDHEQLETHPENFTSKTNDELVNVMHELRLREKEFCKKILNKKLVQYNKGSSSKHVKEVPTKESIWVKKKKEVKNQILEDCSLKQLISTLQKFANDSSIDVNQAGFGSYIANHVLKEKIARYNQASMIPRSEERRVGKECRL